MDKELLQLLISSLVESPQFGVVVTALAGLAVAGFAIYALMQAIDKMGGKK